MEDYGFVYIWFDRKHKRYYVGCHWGREDDGYICSSGWMNKAYKRRPADFKRRIVSRVYTSRLNLLEEEHRWLSMIRKEELKVKYYNLRNHHFNHWSATEQSKLTVGEKISKKHRENPDWGKWSIGKSVSAETREKLRKSRIGKTHSEKTKEKLRKTRSKYPQLATVKEYQLLAKE